MRIVDKKLRNEQVFAKPHIFRVLIVSYGKVLLPDLEPSEFEEIKSNLFLGLSFQKENKEVPIPCNFFCGIRKDRMKGPWFDPRKKRFC